MNCILWSSSTNHEKALPPAISSAAGIPSVGFSGVKRLSAAPGRQGIHLGVRAALAAALLSITSPANNPPHRAQRARLAFKEAWSGATGPPRNGPLQQVLATVARYPGADL